MMSDLNEKAKSVTLLLRELRFAGLAVILCFAVIGLDRYLAFEKERTTERQIIEMLQASAEVQQSREAINIKYMNAIEQHANAMQEIAKIQTKLYEALLRREAGANRK